ncbi:MAG: aminotransferase class I/II-fold pyridoxal phosphate-dependent enzyme, partial [Actinomycetota bacterium]
MDLRRVGRFPPYVFATVNELRAKARRAGEDVIDLGMGNPDIPTPDPIVGKLIEAAQNPRNHRYSASVGLPKLRRAIADWYERSYGVSIDPDGEAIATIGAKEGLTHLMWVLLEPGDSCLVPDPTYPIHTYAPML